MNAIQIDFTKTEEECQIEALKNEISALSTTLHKIRRGTYARLNEQSREIEELKAKQSIIERNICSSVN